MTLQQTNRLRQLPDHTGARFVAFREDDGAGFQGFLINLSGVVSATVEADENEVVSLGVEIEVEAHQVRSKTFQVSGIDGIIHRHRIQMFPDRRPRLPSEIVDQSVFLTHKNT